MSAADKPNSVFIAAILFATAGICLSSYTIKQIGESNRIFSSRQATLRDLAGLREKAERERSGIRLFETSPNSPADLSAAAQKIIPAAKPVFENPKDQNLSGGWTLRETALTLNDLPAAEAGRLVEYLENQNPPWRLAAYEFTATTAERGNTKLSLQTIVRGGAK